MKYDRDRVWVREILNSVNVLNTLHGGSSQPIVKTEKKEEVVVISIRVPGVNTDELKIDIVNASLLVHYFLNPTREDQSRIPNVVFTYPIGIGIDFKNISAEVRNGDLLIWLPNNELSQGYFKRINIDK